MKNQKGITLIALVVTIVVLLILAGTSIAMLTGDNGIITNAQKSKYANTEGEVIDKMQLAFSTVSAEIRVKTATVVNYDASSETNINAFVDLIKNDLGIPNEGENDTGYTVTPDTEGGTIKISYTDSIFDTTGDKYDTIECTITLDTDSATLAGPTRQVQ